MQQTITEECPGGQYIFYTENRNLIRQIKGWKAYTDGRIRTMGERIAGPIGIQFRFNRSMYRRVKSALEACQKVAV